MLLWSFYQYDSGVTSVKSYLEIEKFADSSKNSYEDLKDQLTYWQQDSFCSKIEGTDATSYFPFMKPGEPLHTFVSQIIRSIDLDYIGEFETPNFQIIKIYSRIF